jgi:hypothetical protein
MTIAFVYKWVELETGMWYIGSRTAKGCHPDDRYICSSKVIKPMITENPAGWIREVLETGTPEDMYSLETVLLRENDAKNNKQSYNEHNNDGFVDYNSLKNNPRNNGNPAWNKGLVGVQTSYWKGKSKYDNEYLATKAKNQEGSRNPMYGKDSWNKGKSKETDPRIQQYANTLIKSGKRKNKCVGDENPARRLEVRVVLSEQKIGINNPSWKGYYVSPEGIKFVTSKEAAKEFSVSDVTIQRWVKQNKNGWHLSLV